MDEFGVFIDEGCVAAGFYQRADAEKWMADNCEPGEAKVEQICPDHEEQPRFSCERCAEDDDDDADDFEQAGS